MSSNVIDLEARRKLRQDSGHSKRQDFEFQSHTEILDLTEKRSKQLEQDRRAVKRTILTEFLGTYVVIPQLGLQKIELYDVSNTGIAFDLDHSQGRFGKGEEVAVRVYLNRDTYFPFTVQVTNMRDIVDEGVVRHGAEIVTGTVNDIALQHFIAFIENVSASLRKDDGDVLVSNLQT